MSIALAEFADKYEYAFEEKPASSDFNALQDGLQAEMEGRMEAWAVPGVISGGACSINGTDIDVASIDAYAKSSTKLKRYSGSDAVSFTAGDASDTYYIYLDPTDDVTPLTKSTVAPTAGTDCCLCQVDWNGTDTLSNLVDLREWGIFPMAFHFQVIGAVTADTIGMLPLPYNFWIETVKGSLEVCGDGGGPMMVDLHAGAGGSESTIWTTQTRRLSIAHDATDGAVAEAGVPQANRKLTAGQKIVVITDAVNNNSTDLSVIVIGRRY